MPMTWPPGQMKSKRLASWNAPPIAALGYVLLTATGTICALASTPVA